MDKLKLSSRLSGIVLYSSAPHPCSYLPLRAAVTGVVDPAARMDMRLYSLLVDYGFRRSGAYVYRPQCPGCNSCLSARIPVEAFRPDRSQKRTWARNEDLTVVSRPGAWHTEHFALYRRYLRARHPSGEMDSDNPEQYREFILCPWSDTSLIEFRDQHQLVAVAVCDRLSHGLSAVYTFYDPAQRQRSLGVYAVLWQIEAARQLGVPWVYLGYWIKECAKMSYKSRYRPLEVYRDRRWELLSP